MLILKYFLIYFFRGNFTTDGIKDTLTWSATQVKYFTHSAVDWCRQLWT